MLISPGNDHFRYGLLCRYNEQGQISLCLSLEEEGSENKGEKGKVAQLNQLDYFTSIFVDDNELAYISERNNHHMMKWEKDGREDVCYGW